MTSAWTQNLYTYTGNNPVNFVDPTGHFADAWSNVIFGVFTVVAVVATVASGGVLGPLAGVALATMAAGGTVLATSGASELIEESYGVNPIKDGLFGGNDQAMDTYTAMGELQALGGYALYEAAPAIESSWNYIKASWKYSRTNNIPTKYLDEMPENVQDSYRKYDENGWKGNVSGQTSGTGAGGNYENDGRNGTQVLPKTDSSGSSIDYREFDVNNRIAGMARDTERFVVGSNKTIYYTGDHYVRFTQLLERQ